MAIRNIKLTICYDGTNYHGWQYQPNEDTVEGQIVTAFEKLCGCNVEVNGSSRTDAGVHALGQVANVKIDTPIPIKRLAKALTDCLPNDIAVTCAEDVDMDFDAIKAAKSKLYRYTICTAEVRPVLRFRYCWHYPAKLDFEQMDQAARLLVGTKDFKSFASAADKRVSSVRTILKCQVSNKNDEIYIDVEGNGFLYNMVRNIAGSLTEIGRGRWNAEQIEDILQAKDRCAAGPLAPAAGLCLMKIDY